MFADEKTFVCNPRPNRRNDVIWTEDPSTIEPIVRVAHSVSINAFGAFSASGKSPLFFFFLRILLHRSTFRSSNPLCCQQREISSVANTGRM